MLIEYQTTKPEGILKLLQIVPKNCWINFKTNVSAKSLNSREGFYGKIGQTRKKLDKLTIYFYLNRILLSFSMVNLVNLYFLRKHTQFCFNIPYSICCRIILVYSVVSVSLYS